jgi:hypothetical protein
LCSSGLAAGDGPERNADKFREAVNQMIAALPE